MKWKCPETGRLKLNTDASMRAGCGASIEGVLRDSLSRVEWCFSERCCTVDVGVAEALAIRRCLQYAWDQDVRDLVVESDAQTVVYALIRPR